MNELNRIWKAKHKNATIDQVNYALKDIKEALDANSGSFGDWYAGDHDYLAKLWSEWDYLVVKKQQMEAK